MDGLIIREMEWGDAALLAKAFASMNKTLAQYERYLAQNRGGQRVTLVAVLKGALVGYGNVIWQPGYPPFRDQGIPEINDLNVVAEYRRRGIGSALVAACEDRVRAADRPVVGIGVGITPDYDPARRLYPQLGYVFSGSGVVPDPWGGVEYLTKTLIRDA